MPIDFNYGRRTGVTTFKKRTAELCDLFRKFQPTIEAWVSTSGLSTSDKAAISSLISAVNAACDAVKKLPDD
jgi:hypothetical protein